MTTFLHTLKKEVHSHTIRALVVHYIVNGAQVYLIELAFNDSLTERKVPMQLILTIAD